MMLGGKFNVGKKAFLKVDIELVRELGEQEAILYAFLENLARAWEKDKNDYMAVWTKYIVEQLGWSKPKFVRVRDNLSKTKLIKVQKGKNQNTKTKYKLL